MPTSARPVTVNTVEHAAEVSEQMCQQLIDIALNVVGVDLAAAHAEVVLRIHNCDMQAAVGFLQAGHSSADELEKILQINPKPGSGATSGAAAETQPTALSRTKSYVQRMAKREHAHLIKNEGMEKRAAGTVALERAIGHRRDKTPIPEEELHEFALRHLDAEIEHLMVEKHKSRPEAETIARLSAGLPHTSQVPRLPSVRLVMKRNR